MEHNLTAKDLFIGFPEVTEGEAHQILEKYGFTDLDRANRNLQAIADSPVLRHEFADLSEILLEALADSPDVDAALNNFERFTVVTFSRMWLFHLLRDAPFLVEILATCFGSSTYLSDVLVRNPEYFNEIIDADVMSTSKTREIMYTELSRAVRLVQSVEQKLNIIRRYKRKESLRIGLLDLLGDADVERITLELSNLAEATLQLCYEIGVAELTPVLGTPLGEDEKTRAQFTVLAMGKFGGYELNFSSDIDLMFVYSHDGQTDKGGENSQYFAKLCEFIIKAMSEMTADGYVFRVDIRLRPESSTGAIARSISSYEAYYEGWGEIWERQALIKARPVAGDMELGKEFIRMIQPFVYQRYLDEFSLSEIKAEILQTKARIERTIITEKGDPNTHVKLGIGGIRDVEFTIQSLQLIHGGPIPALRNRNSLETIELLYQYELLSPEDRDILSVAYRFLRAVEHRIQIEGDQQRYVLPSKTPDLIKLAKSAGYPQLEHFETDYTRHTTAVREVFEKILETPVAEGEIAISSLLTTQDEEMINDVLTPFGFKNPREARHRLKLMAEGPEGIRFSPNVRRAFVELSPMLLEALRESPDPDMALHYIESFASVVGAPSSYYTMFQSNPAILQMLTRLCGTSLFLADLLIAHPESFDILTIPAVMERPKTLEEKSDEAALAITDGKGCTSKGEIGDFDSLRQYKNSEILRLGMRNILGLADLWLTIGELSDLAEATLQAMYTHVSDQLRTEHGIPMIPDGTEATLAIIGMGKFGGRELNFSSDLDVMMVYTADGTTTKGMSNADYFGKLGLELVNCMKGNGPAAIYELDLRLRPFGTGGAIALPLSGYQNYYEGNYAETWERQALIRARPVAGAMALGDRFLELAHGFAYRQPLTDEQVAGIVHNRQRKEAQATRSTTSARRRRGRRSRAGKGFSSHTSGKGFPSHLKNVKSGYGGLVDIEFAVQTLQLIHGTAHPNVRAQNTFEAIDQLHGIDTLTTNQRDQLTSAYEFLRRVENSLRIVHDRPLDDLPDHTAELEKLAKRLGYVNGEGKAAEVFLKEYQQCTERTRALFNQLLEGPT